MLRRAAWIACIAGILVQSSFLFTGGTLAQTLVSVVLIASASVLWIWRTAGWREAIITALGVMTIGYFAEFIGVATGFPFGEYAYSGSLGPALFGVSLIVPVAWLMLAYPAWHVSRFLVRGNRVFRVLLGAWALTVWDFFLDAQMVAAGNWGWANPEPSLIGIPGIPFTNYAGWLLVGVLLMSFLELRHARAVKKQEETIPPIATVIYLWTFIGSIVANLTFWDRPSIALVGGVLMATVAIPLCVQLLRAKRVR